MTDKQLKFVDEYLLCGNASKAARCAGYSDKSARYQGSKLLRNVEVQSEIERRRELMTKEKILTATDLQEFLSAVIRGEVQDEQLMTRLIGKGCSIVESHEYRASVKDRLRAAELLGKIIGAFDKQSGSDSGRLFLETMARVAADIEERQAANESADA